MSTTHDEVRIAALRVELAKILGYDDDGAAGLEYVGVANVGPQRVLGCELYEDPAGNLFAVGFADDVATAVFRVRETADGYRCIDVVYDHEALRDVVGALADIAGYGHDPVRAEVRRRALAAIAPALGGARLLSVELHALAFDELAGGEGSGGA